MAGISDITAQPPAAATPALPARYTWSPQILTLLYRLTDILLLTLAAGLAAWLRFGTLVHSSDQGVMVALALLLHLGVAGPLKAYDDARGRGRAWHLGRLLGAWSLTIAGLIVLCYASKTADDMSRLWMFSWWLVGCVALGISRLGFVAIHGWALERGLLHRRGILIAPASNCADLVQVLHGLDPQLTLDTIPVAGDADLQQAANGIVEGCARQPLHCVILAPPLDNMAAFDAYVQTFRFLPAEVLVAPPLSTLCRTLNTARGRGMPVMEVVARPPLTEMERLVKRMTDLIWAALLLLLFSPLMLLIALAIRLDSPGPVFFLQERVGFGRAHFRVWKFRTMTWEASCSGNVTQAVPGDSRVTRVGRILRASSLDELPQLLNVLRGDMSLVGPRPHAIAHDQMFSQQLRRYMARQRVKPGMTGLAQVSGSRGVVHDADELNQRVELDLTYVENWSLMLDLKILLRTLLVVFKLDAY